MPDVTARELMALIPLLAAKIKSLKAEIDAPDMAEDDRVDAQDMMATYEDMLDSLSHRYDAAIEGGIHLPKAADLVAGIQG